MWEWKLQKIASAIVPILIIGWVFGYKFYTNNNVKQTNKFIEQYNKFTVESNVFVTAIETKVDQETGKLKNPDSLNGLIEKTDNLAKTDCGYLPKKEVKESCENLFKKYTTALTDLKEKGFTEEAVKGLETLDNEIISFQNELTTKLGVKFQ